mgnify:CR=1 FL=1
MSNDADLPLQEAEIIYKDGLVKKIQFRTFERGEEQITFIMADGSRWPIIKEAVENIFIAA